MKKNKILKPNSKNLQKKSDQKHKKRKKKISDKRTKKDELELVKSRKEIKKTTNKLYKEGSKGKLKELEIQLKEESDKRDKKLSKEELNKNKLIIVEEKKKNSLQTYRESFFSDVKDGSLYDKSKQSILNLIFGKRIWLLKLFDGEVDSLIILKLYKKIKNNFRFDKSFLFFGKMIIPIIALILFIVAVVGLTNNLNNKNAKLVKFNSVSQTNNYITICPNINILMSRGVANKQIVIHHNDNSSIINSISSNYSYENNAYWNKLESDFTNLRNPIERYCKKHYIVYHSAVSYNDSGDATQQLLNRGISLIGVLIHQKTTTINNPTIKDDPIRSDNFYIDYNFSDIKLNKAWYVRFPCYTFKISTFYNSYDSESDVILNFNNFLNSYIKSNGSSSKFNYFSNWIPADSIAQYATTQGVSLDVGIQTSSKVSEYLKAVVTGIIFLIIILFIYLIIRRKWSNIFPYILSMLVIVGFIIGVLLLIYPFNLYFFVLFFIIFLVCTFDSIYFIIKASSYLKKFDLSNRFKFVQKNDIKLIAVKTIFDMRWILFLQVGVFTLLGLVMVIIFKDPMILIKLNIEHAGWNSHVAINYKISWKTIVENSSFTQWWEFGVMIILSIIISTIIFVTTFVSIWISSAYIWTNIIKTFEINTLFYKGKHNEIVVENVNDIDQDIDLDKLYKLNPEYHEYKINQENIEFQEKIDKK